MDACSIFPQCVLAIIPLIEGMTDDVDAEWGLFFALWLSQRC